MSNIWVVSSFQSGKIIPFHIDSIISEFVLTSFDGDVQCMSFGRLISSLLMERQLCRSYRGRQFPWRSYRNILQINSEWGSNIIIIVMSLIHHHIKMIKYMVIPGWVHELGSLMWEIVRKQRLVKIYNINKYQSIAKKHSLRITHHITVWE